jgi:hypothetical protein
VAARPNSGSKRIFSFSSLRIETSLCEPHSASMLARIATQSKPDIDFYQARNCVVMGRPLTIVRAADDFRSDRL